MFKWKAVINLCVCSVRNWYQTFEYFGRWKKVEQAACPLLSHVNCLLYVKKITSVGVEPGIVVIVGRQRVHPALKKQWVACFFSVIVYRDTCLQIWQIWHISKYTFYNGKAIQRQEARVKCCSVQEGRVQPSIYQWSTVAAILCRHYYTHFHPASCPVMRVIQNITLLLHFMPPYLFPFSSLRVVLATLRHTSTKSSASPGGTL